MIFFVLVLLLICFSGVQMAKPNEFQKDYISRDNTAWVKGIFVILILFSHGKSYIELGGVYDDPYTMMQNHLNQMVVAMFLFYSGYGIMEQIKKREFAYIKSIPMKRFPNLLLNYDIAVILFVFVNWYLGTQVTLKKFLLSLVAWDAIGNSAWYIFVILALYVITFVAFFPIKWVKKPWFKVVSLLAVTALSVALVYALMVVGKHKVWYNTLILYVFGMWYSFFKAKLEKLLMKNDFLYFLILGIVFTVYVLSFRKRWDGIEIYTVWALCFTTIAVMFTMKVQIKSRVLDWFGNHVFSIYILQRIPMMIFISMPFFQYHKYLFLIASYVAVIPLALAYDWATGKLTKLIWGRKKKSTVATPAPVEEKA